ncbi:MAG: DUF4292 domain-containing protein [Bacteroidales bacterium]
MKQSRLILLIVVATMAACGPVKEVVSPEPEVIDHNASRAMSSMAEKEAMFDFFSTRFSGNANIDDSNYSVSGNIRIKKDSAIYISVAPILGIELARLLVTPDSVHFVNRMEGTYFEGDVDYLNTLLNTRMDYNMLQALLVGNNFSRSPEENYELSMQQEQLLLKRRGSVQQNILLDPVSYRIKENHVLDQQANISIRATYNRHQELEGQELPQELVLTLTEGNTLSELSVRYNRSSINQPQSISFSVPDSYTPLNN